MSKNMRLAIIFCENSEHKLVYSDGELHPEQPGRVTYAKKHLEKKGYKKYFVKAKEYDGIEIYKFLKESNCSDKHLDLIKSKFVDINSAYSLGEVSYRACINGVKCLMTMCDLIKEDKIDYAINMIRPPGHHCCHKTSNPAGFCLINTAIAASTRLLKRCNKLSIFDIDLHHGGGTQKMMEKNRSIMYTSIHNRRVWTDGIYPRSALHIKRDRVINVALPGLSNDKDYIKTSECLIREMREFSDEMLVLSAGIDAHKEEGGVGNSRYHRMNLTSGYYGKLGSMLRGNFKKTFVILEGGYNEKAIAESFEKMIEGFLGEDNFVLDTTPEKKSLDKLLKKIDLIKYK